MKTLRWTNDFFCKKLNVANRFQQSAFLKSGITVLPQCPRQTCIAHCQPYIVYLNSLSLNLRIAYFTVEGI